MYNIVAFNFSNEGTARKIVNDLKSSGTLEGYKIAAKAIVEQNPKSSRQQR